MNKLFPIVLALLCFGLSFSLSLTFLDYNKSISSNNIFSEFSYKSKISNKTIPNIFDKMIYCGEEMISIEECENNNKKYKESLKRVEAYSIIMTGSLRVLRFLKRL